MATRALDRQREFFGSDRSHLIFASPITPPMGDQRAIEARLRELSVRPDDDDVFDLGVSESERAVAAAEVHSIVGDDAVPTVEVCNWGSGFKVAALTGGDVTFMAGTSYLTGPRLEDLCSPGECFVPLDRNRWMKVIDSFLGGVESVFTPELSITPFRFRSPLDSASALRDQAFFTDIYDHPDELLSLVSRCCDQIIAMEREIRRRHPFLHTASNGASGLWLAGHGLWLNGDPIDIISEEAAERLNTPSISRLTAHYSVYFHHHSVGHARAAQVARIPGLYLQNIQQDPNGPLLLDVLEELVEPSRRVPIEIDVDLAPYIADGTIERYCAALRRGRFVTHIRANTTEDLRQLVRELRRVLEDA